MDLAQFRLDFPEFTSTATYPDAQLTFWATLAEYQLVDAIWTDLKPTAVKLYVAHEITIAAQNVKQSAGGGIPGTFGGVASSKAVGSVSISYDSANTTEKDAGWWNLTTYGRQLYRLIQLYGSGCIQL